jgi:pyruvate dehydrogenase E2 component (dihydrolipoamide acetyltransferase)
MLLPLNAVWLAAHGAYRALGFRSLALQVGGRTVHLYERRGTGTAPPLILVHGMGGNAAGFIRIARPLLRSARRVVALELPGHGRSLLGAGERPASIAECADVVIAAATDVRERCVLVGNSLGGALALAVAAARPDLVAGVVGLNPAGAPLIGADRDAVVHAFRGGSSREALETNRLLYSRPPRVTWLFARDLARHWASAPVQHFVAELRGELPELDLAAVEQPVLILWGKDDGLLPASSVEYFRERLRHGLVEVIASCGHLPMMEQSAAVAARIGRFLRELS